MAGIFKDHAADIFVLQNYQPHEKSIFIFYFPGKHHQHGYCQ